MSRNPFANASIWLINIIWKGKIGRSYNQKTNTLCRFHPSCSTYAMMALDKYGFIKGWYLALHRIKRCNISNTDTCIDFP